MQALGGKEERWTFLNSLAFRHLINEGKAVKELAAGCGARGCNLEEWENRRQFIGEAFTEAGSVFDIGCGNGFLLRSLQEWSGVLLTPYGIDINSTLISEAKELFPEHSAYFLVYGIDDLFKPVGHCYSPTVQLHRWGQ